MHLTFVKIKWSALYFMYVRLCGVFCMHVCYMNVRILVQVDTGRTFEAKWGSVVLFPSLTEQGWWPYEFLGCTLSTPPQCWFYRHVQPYWEFKIWFFCAGVFCLYICLCITWMPGVLEDKKRVARLLSTGITSVLWNWPWVLWKNI